MRQLRFFLWLVLTGLTASSANAADGWKTVKGNHFVVYYRADEPSAKKIVRASDEYYTRIAADLGYERYSNFWMWDNRVKIFIYPTEEEYQKLPGTREWSLGMADYPKKEIYSFSGQENFTQSVLPHEITHLIFRDFVGTSKTIPLWIDEGVAQWEEPAKRELAQKYMQSLLRQNTALSIEKLFKMRVNRLTPAKDVEKFYMQSVSLIDFMIRTYGGSAFTDFCRQLRDGKSVDDALKKSYSTSIRSVTELDEQWKKYASPA